MKNLLLPAFLTFALSMTSVARAEEPAKEGSEKAEKKAEPAEGKAARADVKACTGIEARKPTGEATTFKAGTLIYVWSQVFDAKDKEVEHVWKKDGTELRRAKFQIGSVRWSVNSRQQNAKKGSYVVEVVAGEEKLGEVSFTVE
jgi:hypothetical protein